MKIHDAFASLSISEVLKTCGLAGCGGAGFPTWPKYQSGEVELKALVVNAQESEPGYYIDKWHHKTYASEYAELFRYLLENTSLEKIIVAPKIKDKAWFAECVESLNATELDCTGRNRHDVFAQENPFLVMYTDDRYAFGKEGALLLITGQVKVPKGEVPASQGWVVNNSQTLYYMHQALTKGAAVTDSYVHVYGETPSHIFKSAPIGTPLEDLLNASGTSLDEVTQKGHVIVEGGPGWYDIIDAPAHYSTTRRTNSILIVDPSFRDPTKKDVLDKPNAPGYPRRGATEHEQAPSDPIVPTKVRLQLKDNKAFEIVNKALPCVAVGQQVARGEVIAKAGAGFSIPLHASIDGKVTEIGDDFISIEA